ncbi:MAG: hypothetical protein ABJ327_06080 [Litoreibacter sp.]
MSDEGNTTPNRARTGSLFFESAIYRRNRLIDAARMMPLLAVVLFVFPALLAFDGVTTSSRWIFFFVVWTLLIAATAVLSHAIKRRTIDNPAGTVKRNEAGE